MDFLVEKHTQVPDELSPDERTMLSLAEANEVAALARQGNLQRLWRSPRAGGTVTVGLWKAEDEAALRTLLERLPLRRWMHVDIFVLEPHDNDPAKLQGAFKEHSDDENCLPR